MFDAAIISDCSVFSELFRNIGLFRFSDCHAVLRPRVLTAYLTRPGLRHRIRLASAPSGVCVSLPRCTRAWRCMYLAGYILRMALYIFDRVCPSPFGIKVIACRFTLSLENCVLFSRPPTPLQKCKGLGIIGTPGVGSCVALGLR